MDDTSNTFPEIVGRRKFLYAMAGSLFLSQGCQRNTSRQGSGSVESLVSQFQHDFTKYGYQSYLAEIAEKIEKGAVRGGDRKVNSADADGTAEFRRAWGIEERYEVNWSSLSHERHESRVDGNRLARMRFRLDCGFPVMALTGGGEVRSCYCTAWAPRRSDLWD